MSELGAPKKWKENNFSSHDEEQQIRELQNKKLLLQQATTQKLKSILQNCYQMEDVGNDTNVNLKGQTEKLENIHVVSDNMKRILKKADETSKQMTSFWYSIGKKIKRVFVKENDDDFQYSRKKQRQNNDCPQDFKQNNFIKCQNQTGISSEPQNIDDQYLDEITNQIRKLKHLSKGTNEQLTKQHHLINSLGKKTDENSSKMNEINKRLVKKFF